MKKLAIMFVMLLGSVATMQAQTFDFSCAEEVFVSPRFTLEQHNELVQNDFSTTPGQGSYQHNVDQLITIAEDFGSFTVVNDDTQDLSEGLTFEEAVELANLWASGVSLVEGFTIVQLQSLGDAGFTVDDQGVLFRELNGRDITIAYSSVAIRVQRDDQMAPEFFNYILSGVRGQPRYSNDVADLFPILFTVRDFTSEQIAQAVDLGFINNNNHPDWTSKAIGTWPGPGVLWNRINLQSSANGFIVFDNDGEITPVNFGRDEFIAALTFADNATRPVTDNNG